MYTSFMIFPFACGCCKSGQTISWYSQRLLSKQPKIPTDVFFLTFSTHVATAVVHNWMETSSWHWGKMCRDNVIQTSHCTRRCIVLPQHILQHFLSRSKWVFICHVNNTSFRLLQHGVHTQIFEDDMPSKNVGIVSQLCVEPTTRSTKVIKVACTN